MIAKAVFLYNAHWFSSDLWANVASVVLEEKK